MTTKTTPRPIRLRIMSDLHQETVRHERERFVPPEGPDHDVVVLAGDVCATMVRSVVWAERHFRTPVVMVAGNHEHYGGEILRDLDDAKALAARGGQVRILENDATEIAGVRFVGATLWTDFALFGVDRLLDCRIACERGVADFSRIRIDLSRSRTENEPFTTGHAASRHALSRGVLAGRLAMPFVGPTVVVTHHAPSPRSVAPEYADDPTSAAFASDLTDLVLGGAPDLWIHGHVHGSVDYRIGTTRVVCNPKGYSGENPDFDPELTVGVG